MNRDKVRFTEAQLKEAAFPCGLVAKSFFTDKFTDFRSKGDTTSKQFEINEKGIAWESDIEYKFKNLEGEDAMTKQW